MINALWDVVLVPFSNLKKQNPSTKKVKHSKLDKKWKTKNAKHSRLDKKKKAKNAKHSKLDKNKKSSDRNCS